MQAIVLVILFTLFSSLFADTLIIEPDMGRAPILELFKKADSTINIVMYSFTDSIIMQGLAQAKKAGKNIHILLEPHPFKRKKQNKLAEKWLRAAHIPFTYANKRLLHQKSISIDHHQALIMTGNFTSTTFAQERNFALVIDQPAVIGEIDRVFQADWQHSRAKMNQPSLLWSPENSREKLFALLQQAKTSIKMYAQSITDYKTIGILAKAAHSGVRVDILTQPPAKQHQRKYDSLMKAGVNLYYSKKYYIHAKVILIDDHFALIGSINLTAPSLDKNRELTVVTTNPMLIRQLTETFSKDIAFSYVPSLTFAKLNWRNIKRMLLALLSTQERYLEKFKK